MEYIETIFAYSTGMFFLGALVLFLGIIIGFTAGMRQRATLYELNDKLNEELKRYEKK